MRGKAIIAAAGVGVLALIPLGAASAGASQYAHPKVHKWYASQGGKQNLNRIIKDFGAVSTDAGNDDFHAVATDCQALRSDVQIAQAARPIPLASAQRLWAVVLSDSESGAVSCVSGANDDNASEIESATSDFNSATALLGEIVKVL